MVMKIHIQSHIYAKIKFKIIIGSNINKPHNYCTNHEVNTIYVGSVGRY